ncbi:MAG: sigma-70 family RNA polymerase sigma factor, partial [Colwellia sp.]|nr:sigma-70 family RNA polymerase sigma factor [Colwellia sp.]
MNKKGFGQELSEFEFLALKQGKHLGFNAAYKLYADHVYSLALHIVKNEQTALDIMQTVFEVLLVKSSTLNDIDTLGAWLKQCTINACMN